MEPIFDFEGFVPAQIQQALESAYRSQRRVRIWYGFTESHPLRGPDGGLRVGRSWGDDFNVTGRISRSTRVKIPLLIHNARSHGGFAILVNSIIRIDDIASRTHLFRHPAFRSGFEGSRPALIHGHCERGLGWGAFDDCANLIARFKDFASAKRFIDFQNGERYSK